MSKNMRNTTNIGSVKKNRNERAHQLKVYALGSVLILGIIVLLVNVILDNFLGKALTFDFTDSRSNTISSESAKFIESLPDDTRIRVVGLFNRPDSFEEQETQKYLYIVPLLDDYVKKSRGKISVEYVDLQMNPGIVKELDPSGAYSLSKMTGQFVVYYNGRLDIINPIDCYSIDTEYLDKYDKYMATGNNAEYTFTNSMMSLVKGFTNKAYFITGLKEGGSDQLKKLLKSMGVQSADLAVSDSFKVPDDCNLLILNGPNTDITEKMYVEIKDYLSKGGKVIAAVEYYIDNAHENFTNLNRLLNEMNINIEPCFISENDPSYQLEKNAMDSLADIAKGFSEFTTQKQLHITLARPLSSAGINNENIVSAPVLQTSSNASKSVADANNQAMQYGTDTGIFNAAMYSANTQTGGEIFVFGTLNFTADNYFSNYTLNDRNADFTKSCVRSMLPTSKSYNINIPVKKIDNYMLSAEKATTSSSTTVMIVFMIILPVILSSAAVIVYNKRKNL